MQQEQQQQQQEQEEEASRDLQPQWPQQSSQEIDLCPLVLLLDGALQVRSDFPFSPGSRPQRFPSSFGRDPGRWGLGSAPPLLHVPSRSGDYSRIHRPTRGL